MNHPLANIASLIVPSASAVGIAGFVAGRDSDTLWTYARRHLYKVWHVASESLTTPLHSRD